MSNLQQFGAVLTVLLVATALVVAQGIVPTAALGSTDTTATQTHTTLTTCQTISESGTYVLGDDLATDASTCLTVDASDVTIDGDGHVLAANTWEKDDTSILVTNASNVTVRNVGFRNWDGAIRYRNATGEIRNVTTEVAETDIDRYGDVTIERNSTVTVADSRLTHFAVKTILEPAEVTVRNNSIESGVSLSGATGTVENNTVAAASIGPYSHDLTLRHNDIIENGLSVRGGDNITVTRNHIDGGTTGEDTVVKVANVGENFELTQNVIENGVRGVSIEGNEGSITVTENHIRNADTAISFEHVSSYSDDGSQFDACVLFDTVANVTVQRNALTNTTHGIDNDADAVLDASGNYWGSSDGPSSPSDTTLTDPVTGQAADGNGATVSIWEEQPTYTNVHFANSLEQIPSTVPSEDDVGDQSD